MTSLDKITAVVAITLIVSLTCLFTYMHRKDKTYSFDIHTFDIIGGIHEVHERFEGFNSMGDCRDARDLMIEFLNTHYHSRFASVCVER